MAGKEVPGAAAGAGGGPEGERVWELDRGAWWGGSFSLRALGQVDPQRPK